MLIHKLYKHLHIYISIDPHDDAVGRIFTIWSEFILFGYFPYSSGANLFATIGVWLSNWLTAMPDFFCCHNNIYFVDKCLIFCLAVLFSSVFFFLNVCLQNGNYYNNTSTEYFIFSHSNWLGRKQESPNNRHNLIRYSKIFHSLPFSKQNVANSNENANGFDLSFEICFFCCFFSFCPKPICENETKTKKKTNWLIFWMQLLYKKKRIMKSRCRPCLSIVCM